MKVVIVGGVAGGATLPVVSWLETTLTAITSPAASGFMIL